MLYVKNPMIKAKNDATWKKYCGFLDLSTEQFMAIQEALLLNQLETIAGCQLARKLIGEKIPSGLDEFRRTVPLTNYADYLPELYPGMNNPLPEEPHCWAETTGGTVLPRRIPWTSKAYQCSLDNLMAAFLLACSNGRGKSSLNNGDHVLYNVAPEPYLSGFLATGASNIFNLQPVIPPDMYEGMEFKEKIAKGFEVSLRTGVDIMVAMTSVLVKMGNDFGNISKKSKISKHLSHPREFSSIIRAYLKSKIEKRGILPKDLWPLKALICWGMDTDIYREQVYKQWGHYPYEFHACTEAGIIAVQSWTREDMTFIPNSNFYEFIPEAEWQKSKNDRNYQPRTVLISDVLPGERYELVITSFNGMPFIRYRLGHLIQITTLNDVKAGINLPQMRFEARADDLIDIGGFTRVSEKTVALALVNAGLKFEDWTMRKEISDGIPTLHLYIEFNQDIDTTNLASDVNRKLMEADGCYRDLVTMMEMRPLRVTVLPPGTFHKYYVQKGADGCELAQRKPPRINPSDNIINELITSDSRQPVEVPV